jgi:biotin carboxyl carrier protein
MKKLRVTVEGKVYEVLVEVLDETSPPAPAVATPAPSIPAAASPSASPPAPATSPVNGATSPGDVKSPLAGKIVSVDVKTGQPVEEGAQVLTIEAMKMNTYIYAHCAGRIESINVNTGDAVEEGTLLLRIV